jgi:hypothetical protein
VLSSSDLNTVASSPSSSTLSAGLQIYYKFDVRTGTSLIDYSGNSRSLIILYDNGYTDFSNFYELDSSLCKN